MSHAAVLGRALRLLDQADRLRTDAGWHPAPEDLTAYRDGRLAPRRAARLQGHLATCLDCPDVLLALELFLEALPEEEDMGEPAGSPKARPVTAKWM